jgi:hypothetical protein
MTPVELDCEQDIRGLRTSVGDEGLVRCCLKVRVIEIDIAETMP